MKNFGCGSSRNSPSGAMRLIGNMISERRKEKGLSRARLAILSGVSVSQLRSLESGTGKISMVTCLQVAAALNLSLAAIIRNAEGNSKK
jgi:transcriptional regulator with XRE-family HTH domain